MFFGGEGFVYVRQREWYLAFKKKKAKAKSKKALLILMPSAKKLQAGNGCKISSRDTRKLLATSVAIMKGFIDEKVTVSLNLKCTKKQLRSLPIMQR